MKELLEQARKNLLELGLRNNFINSRDSTLRNVRVVEESSKEVFGILIEKELTMSFHPKGKDEDEIDREFGSLFKVESLDSVSDKNLTDSILQTLHSPTDLQKRLRNMEKLAKLSIEEKGANILFLSLGFVRWYESDNSETPRISPIILVPVTIYRNSINAPYKIKYTSDEIGVNISFLEKLRSEFGIKIKSPEEISTSNILKVYKDLALELKTQPRWEVLENEIRLGLYSFSKFLMYRDLDESIWPNTSKPYNHPLLAGLLSKDGFTNSGADGGNNYDELDQVSYSEIYHTLPSDSSQQEVIFSSRDGQNLVVQGPPGTGKSQTITNIISDYLARGKKILFVAEKLAALNVVSSKLKVLGLDDLLMEIHSHKSKKKDFINELGRTLQIDQPQIKIDLEEELTDYDKVRSILNRYSHSVNQEIEETGFTPYKAFGKVISIESKIKEDALQVDLDKVELSSYSDFKRKKEIVDEISITLKKIGSFKDLSYSVLSPDNYTFYEAERFITDIEKTLVQLKDEIDSIDSHAEEFIKLIEVRSLSEVKKLENTLNFLKTLDSSTEELNFVQLDQNNTGLVDCLLELYPSIEKQKEKKSGYHQLVFDKFWNDDIHSHHSILLEHTKKWYKFLFKEYRQSKATLKSYFKPGTSKITDDEILKLTFLKLEIEELESTISNKLTPDLSKVSTKEFSSIDHDWETLMKSIRWYNSYTIGIKESIYLKGLLPFIEELNFDQIPDLNCSQLSAVFLNLQSQMSSANYTELEKLETLSFEYLIDLITRWIEQRESFVDYIQILNNIKLLKKENLGWVYEILENWDRSDKYLSEVFEYNWARAIARKAFKDRKELQTFMLDKHVDTLDRFKIQEDRLLEINVFRILDNHFKNLPRTDVGSGNLGILLREISKKRNHKSIRSLIRDCGQLLLDIKPIFLMSPLSVSQFIESNSLEFDLVIFDEASQIKPVEAFGSILRGKRLMVVGDSKQLPPTSFFDLSIDDEEDESDIENDLKTSEVESILALAEAKLVPQKMLRWHYRSKHQSLISVSNREFYNSNLLVFPSSSSDYSELGFSYKQTTGTYYEPGKGGRVNRGEAKFIVQEIINHSIDFPNQSLGVVAFSQTQAKLIEDYLEQELKINPNPKAERFIYGFEEAEPFFVKNLENVQGDERDVILISVGYGFQESDKFSYSFGPIMKEGGERRLNVLFSRAKKRSIVYANFRGDDVDLSRTDSQGIRILKEYLNFAEKKEMRDSNNSYGNSESLFEEEVASLIIDSGFEIVQQVGSNGFRIDIGVKDPKSPGKFLLAVECDGASYHSSRTARDRDKSRQSILESLGWKFHRIWSTDWFLNRERQSQILIQKIKDEIDNELSEIDIHKEKEDSLISRVSVDIDIAPTNMYKKFEKIMNPVDELHTYFGISDLILEIVEFEQPIHKEVILTRVLELTGNKKAGSRIRDYFEKKLRHLNTTSTFSGKKIQSKKDVYYTNEEIIKPSIGGIYRDRSELSRREFTMDFIPFIEIQNAILELVKSSYGITKDEILIESTRMFGFKKSTDEMKRVVEKEIVTLRSHPLNLISFIDGSYFINVNKDGC